MPDAPKWPAACLAQTRLPLAALSDGVPYQPRDPLYALDQGVALVPEDRKRGAVLGLSIRDNLSLSCLSSLLHWRWFVNTRKEDDLIESYRRALQIKMVNSAQEVRKLSGGNQQK